MEYIQSLSQLKSNFKEALISLHFVLTSRSHFLSIVCTNVAISSGPQFLIANQIQFDLQSKYTLYFSSHFLPLSLHARNFLCEEPMQIQSTRVCMFPCARVGWDRDVSDFANCWSGMQTHLIYQRIGQLRQSREWAVVQETKWMFHWLAAFA